VHLVRRLGEIECRDCGHVREPAEAPDAGIGLAPGGSGGSGGEQAGSVAGPDGIEPGRSETPGLAEDVERALARVLGRSGRTARIG
jgi:hypothetical protein